MSDTMKPNGDAPVTGVEQPAAGDGDVGELGALVAAGRQMISQLEELLETARQGAASLQEAQTTASTLLGDAQAKLSEVSTLSATAAATKTKIADDQAVIASKSEHIQSAQDHADRVRKELDRIQTALAQVATQTEGLRDRAKGAADASDALVEQIRGAKTAGDAAVSAIVEGRDAARLAGAETKALAEIAASVESRVSAYEKRLAELEAQSDRQLGEITRLLPGATAAGLAHSFDDRRKTFLRPASDWQRLFVVSVGALALLAVTGLLHAVISSPLTYDDLLRIWISRLPIAGAFVWLALYASREAALAKRLEEDYGYKAVISASFQGFQQQMAEVSSKVAPDSPLTRLCNDTLATIASPPGRIYEKHRLTVTPAGEAVEAIAPSAPPT